MLEHTSTKFTNAQIAQIGKPSDSGDDPSSPPPAKKKRNLPGNPDPDAEVIALSPKTLLATNRFLCEICGKGFQRDQNLQLHRRGHNLPWKLRQRSSKEPKKRVYVCPEKSCVHHHPGRALGDLTGIKKHFCRKHGEKKWKCDKCSKRYAVQSDWKAHSKVCGTREYRCDCGTRFSRRDSFVTHRAFCDALAEETARVTAVSNLTGGAAMAGASYRFIGNSVRTDLGFPYAFPSMQYKQSQITSTMEEASPTMMHGLSLWNHTANLHHMAATSGAATTRNLYNGDPFAVPCTNSVLSSSSDLGLELLSSSMPTTTVKDQNIRAPSSYSGAYDRSDYRQKLPADMSATALLQKAAQIGATSSDPHHLFSYEMRCNNDNINTVNKYNMMPTLSNFTDHQMLSTCTDHVNGSDQVMGKSHSADHNFSSSTSQSQNISKGQTRDFLGVGFHSVSLCPSSIQETWI